MMKISKTRDVNFRSIAVVAHDLKKDTMIEWARSHRSTLVEFALYGTGTTGGRLSRAVDLGITCLKKRASWWGRTNRRDDCRETPRCSVLLHRPTLGHAPRRRR